MVEEHASGRAEISGALKGGLSPSMTPIGRSFLSEKTQKMFDGTKSDEPVDILKYINVSPSGEGCLPS